MWGIGATLYVSGNERLRLAGFYSAKLKKHQVTWLPCEVEALGIAAAVRHYSPYIIQAKKRASVKKLCCGEFSASPRVTTFLSVVSRYQIDIRHLAGSVNVLSDFSSRNAPECSEPHCQICSFITRTEDSVVRSLSVTEGMSGYHLLAERHGSLRRQNALICVACYVT